VGGRRAPHGRMLTLTLTLTQEDMWADGVPLTDACYAALRELRHAPGYSAERVSAMVQAAGFVIPDAHMRQRLLSTAAEGAEKGERKVGQAEAGGRRAASSLVASPPLDAMITATESAQRRVWPSRLEEGEWGERAGRAAEAAEVEVATLTRRMQSDALRMRQMQAQMRQMQASSLRPSPPLDAMIRLTMGQLQRECENADGEVLGEEVGHAVGVPAEGVQLAEAEALKSSFGPSPPLDAMMVRLPVCLPRWRRVHRLRRLPA
jgi:hypothetical protein